MTQNEQALQMELTLPSMYYLHMLLFPDKGIQRPLLLSPITSVCVQTTWLSHTCARPAHFQCDDQYGKCRCTMFPPHPPHQCQPKPSSLQEVYQQNYRCEEFSPHIYKQSWMPYLIHTSHCKKQWSNRSHTTTWQRKRYTTHVNDSQEHIPSHTQQAFVLLQWRTHVLTFIAVHIQHKL